ncbi:MAG: hypothetical protein LUD27_07205 [Clostridia bacterium]|nr:hypothetical protein [Clostridia bacterium]
MSSISLDNAWLLIIAVPIIILLAVPFFIAVRKDNRNGHNIASGVLHIVLAAIIAFAAAGVTIETTLTETNVFVVADISYSANRNLDLIDEYIEDIQDNLPDNSKMGVICFGKDYTVLTGMGDKFTSVKDAESEVDVSQTNIAKALKFAGDCLDDKVIKRIVLITDAKQTGGSDDDDLKQTVDDLKARDVHIDAIYLDDNISDDVAEVQLSGVNGNSTAYKGQESSLSVSVQSGQAAAATVTLSQTDENGQETVVSSKSVSLNSGTNSLEFDLPSDRASGVYTYTATVEAGDDANPYNNSGSFTQEVVGKVNILFITGGSDNPACKEDRDNAKEIFDSNEDVDVDYYYNRTSIPYSVTDVCEYDIIVLADVDVSTLDNYSMFIDSLEIAVSQLGKSLIAIGDLNLQNNGGDEALTKLESMLPVNYGNTARDQKLYTIIIDCSYSMSINSKFASAKAAAEAVIDLLNEDDALYIVKFYSEVDAEETRLFTEVGDGTEAKEFIEDLTYNQGTVISGGLNNVLGYVPGLGYSSASVLIITDGNNSSSDNDATYTAAQTLYNDYNIITSVIDVSLLATDKESSQVFLDALATYGGGEHYTYNKGDPSNSDLSGILNQISNELGETVVEGSSHYTVNVSYKNYNDSVLDGVKNGGYVDSYKLEYITGFVVSSAKASATTILTTSYTSEGSSRATTVPVYSYWNYGNGSSASFTSNMTTSWASQWISSGVLNTFISDAVTSSTPDERVETPYTVTINEGSDSYSVEITPVEVKSGATVNAYLTKSDGTQQVLTVVFDSTSYVTSFSVDEADTYTLTVEYEYKDALVSSDYYVDVAYLSEYDSFTLYEASLLYKVIGSDGTVSEDGAFKIENDESEVDKSELSLTIPLLVAAVVLFVADIVIRKLKWNDIVSLFKKVGKERKT